MATGKARLWCKWKGEVGRLRRYGAGRGVGRLAHFLGSVEELVADWGCRRCMGAEAGTEERPMARAARSRGLEAMAAGVRSPTGRWESGGIRNNGARGAKLLSGERRPGG